MRDQAQRAGFTVDGYIRYLAVMDSVRRHGQVFDEAFYADAEAERIEAARRAEQAR